MKSRNIERKNEGKNKIPTKIKTRSFNWVLNNGYLNSLAYGKGLNLFLFDTGVFIDLDNSYYKSRNGEHHPAEVLENIRDYPLLVTQGVMAEIKKHRDQMKVNGRDEISRPTATLANRLYEDTIAFFKEELDNLDPSKRDFHRLCVRLAAYKAFRNNKRKGKKDKISQTDIELLSFSLDLTLCKWLNQPIGYINILSCDEHIAKTMNYLKKSLIVGEYDPQAISSISFKNYMVRVIPTRNDLRSYLSRC